MPPPTSCAARRRAANARHGVGSNRPAARNVGGFFADPERGAPRFRMAFRCGSDPRIAHHPGPGARFTTPTAGANPSSRACRGIPSSARIGGETGSLDRLGMTAREVLKRTRMPVSHSCRCPAARRACRCGLPGGSSTVSCRVEEEIGTVVVRIRAGPVIQDDERLRRQQSSTLLPPRLVSGLRPGFGYKAYRSCTACSTAGRNGLKRKRPPLGVEAGEVFAGCSSVSLEDPVCQDESIRWPASRNG